MDDVVETWLMTSFHGEGRLIPYKRGKNIYRPFLTTRRKEIEKYATNRDLSWIEDPSNKNTVFMRNYVRHQVMPHVLKVNPGIRKTIFKKLIETNSNI